MTVQTLPRKKPLTGPRRDNQRLRLYRSERLAWDHYGVYWKQTIANPDLHSWVDKAMDARPIRSRWGTVRIHVYLKRGGRALGGGGEIGLPLGGRNPWVILHEIAHCLTPGKYAPHGPEFAGVFLFLVETIIGKEEAAVLREKFKVEKVRHNRKAIPAVRSVVPAPAVPQREAYQKTAERAEKRRAAEKARAVREAASKPLTATEGAQAAILIRRAVKAGAFGPSGSKPRVHALATARSLES